MVFGKIEGVLDDYAEFLNTTPERLRIMDVFDQDGDLRPRLEKYVSSKPRLPKQTEKRHKEYKGEIISNLRHLFFALYPSASEKRLNNAPLTKTLLDDIPEAMKPILPFLPRVRGKSQGSISINRSESTLTENGVFALTALLNIWNSHSLQTLEELLITHSLAVTLELKKIASVKEFNSATSVLFILRNKLGFKLPERYQPPIEKEFWPPKLRAEWDIFESLALNGVDGCSELKINSVKLKFSVKQLSLESIRLYEISIARALKVIPYDENLCILDLIKVIPLSENLEDTKKYNPLIDIFQSSEQAKEGIIKGVGFDSSAFLHFVCAVKAIAARNGYGNYIKEFNKAYKINLNRSAKDDRKAAKKAGITMAWIDYQLQCLHIQFKEIVRTESFKRRPGRLDEADRDIGLVLFYVILVTLRYMGYRQQSLVDCKIGENIIFQPDGSIILHFDKTKNNKRLHMEINESRRDSHGLLLDVLSLYYERVYKYLIKQSSDTLNKQFFVTGTKGKVLFRAFKDHGDFNIAFYMNRDRFLDVDTLDDDMKRQLHPHFLRGVCADWMINVRHMTLDEAAEVLGDDPAMLKAAYVDKNRVYDAGAAFDAGNARLRAIRSVTESQDQLAIVLQKMDQSHEKELKARDRELAVLQQARETDAAEIAILRSQIIALNESFVGQRETDEQRHHELMAALNERRN